MSEFFGMKECLICLISMWRTTKRRNSHPVKKEYVFWNFVIDSRKDFSVTGERITFKEYDEMTNDYVDIQKQDVLKDGIKLIFTPPPQKKRKIFRKHRWIVTFSWKLWNVLFKRRKTAELYIEILIVQANFFPWFFALSSFFGVQFNKKRNLWNCEQFAHNFSNYLCATNFLQMLALFKEGFWNFLAS